MKCYEKYTKIESYKKNGFIIIPSVISSDEISTIRDVIQTKKIDASPDKRMFVVSDIFADNDLLNVLLKIKFNKKIHETLGSLFSDKYYFICDPQIQCNMFGNAGAADGWHTDCGSEHGNAYLHEPDYAFGKVGVYLQDNTHAFGGGIDVMPGSHKVFKHFNGLRVPQYLCQTIGRKLLLSVRKLKKLTVSIKAGDAVFFDSRLLHRSTTPQSLLLDETERHAQGVSYSRISHVNSKYAFYWDLGSKKDATHFLRNACKRAMLEEVLKGTDNYEMYYADYLRNSYPDDYPTEYVEALANVPQANVLSLDRKKSRLFKALFD